MPDGRDIDAEREAAKKKRWAYFISVGLPPFGLIYVFKYWSSGTSDGKRTALICLALTAASLLASWLIGVLFLSSAGPELDQLRSIDANGLKDLLQ